MIGSYDSSAGYEAQLCATCQSCSFSFKPLVRSPNDDAGFFGMLPAHFWHPSNSGTHSHLLREVFLMILAGVPLEREIGTLFLELQGVQIAFARLFFPLFFCMDHFQNFGLVFGFLASKKIRVLRFFVLVFLFSGAVGCTLSWHTLRQSLRSLGRSYGCRAKPTFCCDRKVSHVPPESLLFPFRRHPEFQEMPPEHVDAIANLSNSRGASACVYGTAFLAILLIGDQNLADNFKISAEYANALLVAARFLPEFLSPLSTRLRKHLFWSLSIFLLLIAMAVSLPARLTVSNSLLFWFFFHCLFRTYPWLLDLGPPREFASTDYMGHIYGAIFSALCGSWHLVNRILQSDLPHLQSWLALIVLCISTLP